MDKRFALLCQHFYPEMVSTGLHMTELSTRLAELGWQITVYCAKPSWGLDQEGWTEVPNELTYQGVRIRRVPTLGKQQGGLLSRLLFAVTFVLAVGWEVIRKRGEYPGLVVTTNPPFLGLVSWLYSRVFRRPYLLIVYDVYPDIAVRLGALSPQSWLTKTWAWMTRLILREAAVVVVIGRDMEKIIQEKLPSRLHDRIVLIPNWSDERHVKSIPKAENRFRQELQLNGTFVVQYAGRMGRTHNLEPLLEAAQRMNGSDVLFQFVGEGAKRQKLEQIAAAQGLDNVQFLPYQPTERLAEMLSAADLAVVCLESHFTGMSVPSKSYGVIASGTPILAFLDPESEIGQMIAETACGLVLRDPTGEQIVSAVQELIAHPERREAMGNAGRQAFLEKYTLTQAARAYEQALISMLD